MAATVWTHRIDGVNVNDFIDYATNVPEAEHAFGATVLLTILADSEPDYQALLTAIRTLYGPGPHTYELTPPGATSSRTMTIYFDGGATVDIAGRGAVTGRAIAPDPGI